MYDNVGRGIWVYDDDNPTDTTLTIFNSLVHGNTEEGLHWNTGNGGGFIVYNNVFYDNGDDGNSDYNVAIEYNAAGNELVKNNIPVNNIVVNQLYQDTTELCEFCKARRGMQQKNLYKIKDVFGEKLNKNLIEVPLFKEEIREYEKLKEMGEFLIN